MTASIKSANGWEKKSKKKSVRIVLRFQNPLLLFQLRPDVPAPTTLVVLLLKDETSFPPMERHAKDGRFFPNQERKPQLTTTLVLIRALDACMSLQNMMERKMSGRIVLCAVLKRDSCAQSAAYLSALSIVMKKSRRPLRKARKALPS